MHTDTRLNSLEVAENFEKTRDYQRGYFKGLFDGRSDPLVRAVYVRFDDDCNGSVVRIFSYDEIIVTAWLIRAGMYRRYAAAMALEGYVLASRESPDGSASFPVPDEKTRLSYEVIDRVVLPQREVWLIAAPCPSEWPAPSELAFVEDYAVWFEINDRPGNLTTEELPATAFKSCGVPANFLRRRMGSPASPRHESPSPSDVDQLEAALSENLEGTPEELLARLQSVAPGVTFVFDVQNDDESDSSRPKTPPMN